MPYKLHYEQCDTCIHKSGRYNDCPGCIRFLDANENQHWVPSKYEDDAKHVTIAYEMEIHTYTLPLLEHEVAEILQFKRDYPKARADFTLWQAILNWMEVGDSE